MVKFLLLSAYMFTAFADAKFVYPHDEIKQFSKYGILLKGVATKTMGAKEFEVWRSSIGVGCKTPPHVHETEEVFIVLKGKILAKIGDQEFICPANSTLICPANIPHQLINIGDEPTEQILVLGIDSKISDLEGKEMNLPWRE